MHHLFIALRPPLSLRAACEAAMDDGPPGWDWQDDEQLHLTLRFIGPVERPLAEDIAVALGQVTAPAPTITLDGVGWFEQGQGGALFARVAPRDPLAALHRKLDRLLVGLGLAPERRSYLPHITLARRRRGAADPARWIERHAGLVSAPVAIEHFTLFESHLGRDGAHYQPVARFVLDPDARTPI
jgi:RNA 2',3'-cyclic 3'-phosphodiesterase